MLVQVTEQDIEEGKRHNCHLCPVALAVARTLGMKTDDVLMTGDVYIRWEGWRLLGDGSFKIRRFAANFDKGKPVKPFSFELRGLPPELQVPSPASQ